MKEQIREFVKQAGGEFWQRLENDVVNPEAFVTFDPPQSLEKFAELLVKDYATRLVQAHMSNTEYAKAMDAYYEQKWAHRFD